MPTGYIAHEDYAEYKLYTHASTYDRAKLKCQEDGATLAIDDSVEDHEFIMKMFPGQNFWIGVNTLEQKGIRKKLLSFLISAEAEVYFP